MKQLQEQKHRYLKTLNRQGSWRFHPKSPKELAFSAKAAPAKSKAAKLHLQKANAQGSAGLTSDSTLHGQSAIAGGDIAAVASRSGDTATWLVPVEGAITTGAMHGCYVEKLHPQGNYLGTALLWEIVSKSTLKWEICRITIA